MAHQKPFRSLAEQLANVEDPAPRDTDPEAYEEASDYEDSVEDSEENLGDDAAREHYEAVGASKLRRKEMPLLGQAYAGATVRRDALESDSELDEDQEASGEDIDASFDGLDSGESGGNESDESHGSGDSDVESAVSSQSDDDGLAPERKPAARLLTQKDRIAMHEMIAAEQKAVASSISQAAQEDIQKGKAVKLQRDTYHAHLNTRIRLQKALIEANSIPAVLEKEASAGDAALEAAETAALKLLNTVTEMQASLNGNSKKRPFEATNSTPLEDIYENVSSAHATAVAQHREVLAKWAYKTQLSSGRPQKDSFGGSLQQPLVSVLDSYLSGRTLERQLERAHTPRSCAPLQAAAGIESDPAIYDDADFYATLLREFIEARSGTDGLAGDLDVDVAALRRANRRHRNDVDTKASKGRKLRYTVHEKLQNFMAPRDVSTWGERPTDELFASLLGRRVTGGLAETMAEAEAGDESNEVGDHEMEGLRLFRGTG